MTSTLVPYPSHLLTVPRYGVGESCLERGPGLKAKDTRGAPGIETPPRLTILLAGVPHNPALQADEPGNARDKLPNADLPATTGVHRQS